MAYAAEVTVTASAPTVTKSQKKRAKAKAKASAVVDAKAKQVAERREAAEQLASIKQAKADRQRARIEEQDRQDRQNRQDQQQRARAEEHQIEQHGRVSGAQDVAKGAVVRGPQRTHPSHGHDRETKEGCGTNGSPSGPDAHVGALSGGAAIPTVECPACKLDLKPGDFDRANYGRNGGAGGGSKKKRAQAKERAKAAEAAKAKLNNGRCKRCAEAQLTFPYVASTFTTDHVLGVLSAIGSAQVQQERFGLAVTFYTFVLDALDKRAFKGETRVHVTRTATALALRAEAHRLDNKFKLAMADSYAVMHAIKDINVDTDAMVAHLIGFARCAASYGDTYQAEQAFHQVLLLEPTHTYAIEGLASLQGCVAVEEAALAKGAEDLLFAPGEHRSYRGLCKFLNKHVEQYVGGEASRPLLRLLQLFAHIYSASQSQNLT